MISNICIHAVGYWACASNLTWQDLMLSQKFKEMLTEENKAEFEIGWWQRRAEEVIDRTTILYEFLINTNNL